jgi:hypothetical protein
MSFFNSFLEIIFKHPFRPHCELNDLSTKKKYIVQQLNILPKVIVEIIISYDYHFEGIKQKYSRSTDCKSRSNYSPISIAMIPDGCIAITSGNDIRILNPKTENEHTIYANDSYYQHIFCIVSFSEGLLIGCKNALGIWNYRTDKFKFISFTDIGTIFDIVIISDELVCINCRDIIIRVYNLGTA